VAISDGPQIDREFPIPSAPSSGSVSATPHTSRSEYGLNVPDFSGRRSQGDSWRTSGSLLALVSAAQHRRGQVEALSETDADFAFGSRSGYRMLGMFSPVRMRPVRLHVTVASESSERSVVRADATTDEDWYLLDVASLSSRQFGKAFSRLFDGLRSAASRERPIGVTRIRWTGIP